MTTKAPSGILDGAIKSAVHEALAELLPEHFDGLADRVADRLRVAPAATVDLPAGTSPSNAPRFVSMTELCTRLGINRTTALRRERFGKLPKRRTFPDDRQGWLSTDIDEWFARAEAAGPDRERNAALASRIGRKAN